VGKWAARLAEKSAAPPCASTDKADRRELVSVMTVTPMGRAGDFPSAQPAALAVVEQAHGARACLVDVSAVVWTDGDMARFIGRRARLMRLGWPEADAEALAERLVMRDRAADDDRVNCTECHHHRPGRCGNHRAAGLHSPEVGRDLAGMLQRCPGHQLMRGGNGDDEKQEARSGRRPLD